MDTIFMNSQNSKTSDPPRLLLNLSDKINLKKVINMLLYQILAFTILEKFLKSLKQNNKFKIPSPTLNYLMDYILYQIFTIILNIS